MPVLLDVAEGVEAPVPLTDSVLVGVTLGVLGALGVREGLAPRDCGGVRVGLVLEVMLAVGLGVAKGVAEAVGLGLGVPVGLLVSVTLALLLSEAVLLGVAEEVGVWVGVREGVELRVAWEVGENGWDALLTGLSVEARVVVGGAVEEVNVVAVAVGGGVNEGSGLVVAIRDSVCAGE